MFHFSYRVLPWRGEEVRARFEQGGREGTRLVAEFVAERARYYCPVDTGFLKASIQVISSLAGALWHVVATAPYARFVEFGSLHRNAWIAPNPFLRRALADGRREFPAILKGVFASAGGGRHLGATIHAGA